MGMAPLSFELVTKTYKNGVVLIARVNVLNVETQHGKLLAGVATIFSLLIKDHTLSQNSL
jgi:hypothetical protein